MSGTNHNTPTEKRRNRKAEQRNPKPEQQQSPKRQQGPKMEQQRSRKLDQQQGPKPEPRQDAEEQISGTMALTDTAMVASADTATVASIDAPTIAPTGTAMVASTDIIPIAAAAPADSVPIDFHTIANAYSDYGRKSLEETRSFVEKLTAVRSLDKAIEVQTEFAKQAHMTFVAESQKICELYSELARQIFRLLAGYVAKTPQSAR